MDWEMISAACAVVSFTYFMLRNLRGDMMKEFEKVYLRFEKIDRKFEQIEGDLTEIKDRLAFLEAANLYTMPIEPVQPNARSQAAREMWKLRKQKRLEQKNKE